MQNRVFHGKQTTIKDQNKNSTDKKETEQNSHTGNTESLSINTEKEQQENSEEKEQEQGRFHTTVTKQEFNVMEEFISLRTIPVIVSNRKMKMTVNALLDDTSTKIYMRKTSVFLLAADTILNSTQVDGSVESVEDEYYSIKLYQESSTL